MCSGHFLWRSLHYMLTHWGLVMRIPWWRHQMETFSVLLALCVGNSLVTSEFPSQGPVTQSFDVFFDLHLNKRLTKQSRPRWFETPLSSLWHRCNNGSLNWFIICSGNGLSPVCHYLNQSWLMVNWNILPQNLKSKANSFLSRKCIWKRHLQNVHILPRCACVKRMIWHLDINLYIRHQIKP